MKLKLALAAAFLFTGGTFIAQAQTSKATVKTATASSLAKTFDKKITQFKTEADATKAAAIFNELNNDMMQGIVDAKMSFANGTTDKEKNASIELMNTRVKLSDEAIKLFKAAPEQKDAIVEALHQYAATL